MTHLTISEARKEFLDLPEKLAREPERAVIITRRGQPVLAVLRWEFYESLVESSRSSASLRWWWRSFVRASRTSSAAVC